jgi:hypothetical protein
MTGVLIRKQKLRHRHTEGRQPCGKEAGVRVVLLAKECKDCWQLPDARAGEACSKFF